MDLPWNLFGRPFKPVALVLMCTMLITAATALDDQGVLGHNAFTEVVAGLALAVAAMFIVGWVWRNQRLAEYAMLGAFAVWLFRSGLYIFVTHPAAERFGLALGWTAIAAGSYILEVYDPGHKAR